MAFPCKMSYIFIERQLVMDKRTFSFILLSLFLLFSCTPERSGTSLRVGLYDNPPKVYRNRSGAPRGIFVDTVNYMAEQEGWNVEYVYGDWNELLKMLAAGELDLMLDVAWSEARSKAMKFSKLPLLSSWLLAYTAETQEILTQSDLNGLKIAVLKGSYQESFLKELREKEGYHIGIVSRDSYTETVDAVIKSEADACVVGRFFEYSNDSRTLTPSPLILAISPLYFAAPLKGDPRIIATVDKYLSRLMSEDHDTYNRILSENLQRFHDYYRRKILIISFSLTLLIAFLALGAITFLRRQIEIKAQELFRQKEAMDHIHRMNLLGQLSSEIAHDFNNILCGISGYMELIDQINENEEIRGMIAEVLEAESRGEKIIGRILSFGRNSETEKEPARLSALIREVTGLLRAGFPSSINIITGYPDNEPDLILDTDGVHECLMNLCTNALQAMGREKGELELILEEKHVPFKKEGTIGPIRPGAYLVLKIRDTGSGIPPEILSRIFEPYFSTKKQGEGTGLGLAVVFNVMKQHGGNIEIRSVPGVGTTFFLYFPRAT